MGPKGKPAAGGASNDEIKFLTLKVVGGEAPSNAVLSSRLAPFGCNPKKSGEEICKQTKEFTNIRIYVTLHIQAREIKKVDILPCCSSYIIKELKEPVRIRRKNKGVLHPHTGNVQFKSLKPIAEKMFATKSLARTLKGAMLEVVGSCKAIGCTIDNKNPKAVTKDIKEGKYQI